MKKVLIYSTPTCTYCKKAKEYFDENDIVYDEIDVSKDMDAAIKMVDFHDEMKYGKSN